LSGPERRRTEARGIAADLTPRVHFLARELPRHGNGAHGNVRASMTSKNAESLSYALTRR
jgi:hypothetical protein